MWYVMQVTSGKERKTIMMMEGGISPGILEKCFVPMRRMKKKYHGEWHEITEKLFPGYVFLVSSQPQSLYGEVKNIPAMTKMLGRCEEYFTPLSEKDVQFLKKLQDIQDIWSVQERKNKKRIQKEKDQETEETIACRNQKEWIAEVGMSQVVIGEGRQIKIVSGPLKNLDGQIKKINLHKRIAMVEAEFMGNKSIIHLGIEIVAEVF